MVYIYLIFNIHSLVDMLAASITLVIVNWTQYTEICKYTHHRVWGPLPRNVYLGHVLTPPLFFLFEKPPACTGLCFH